MKKQTFLLLTAALMTAVGTAQAAPAPATNVVQNITLSLEFISQVEYNNPAFEGFTVPFTNWDVLKTTHTGRRTNVVDTYTFLSKVVTNFYTTKDVVKAINPDMAGGSLVLVTSTNEAEGGKVQIRKNGAVYDVPSDALTLTPGFFVYATKTVIVTNTTTVGTNVTTTVSTNSAGYQVGSATLSLTTTNGLSFSITGLAKNLGQVFTVAGTHVAVKKTTATGLVGTGSDAAGSNEFVVGSASLSGGTVKD